MSSIEYAQNLTAGITPSKIIDAFEKDQALLNVVS